ncbi:MAG TPA: agglutinin biogenesis protein MshI [Burkholderiales bacterium]|nr:agglutinin biogenesis protein MshI [Burkholderiales bacterium]
MNLYGDRAEVGHVRRNGSERPVVDICASFADAGSPVDTLQKMRKEMHLDRYRCATVLPVRQYQLQLVDSPNVPEAEMKSAVRWKLKEFLEYPVETATLDVMSMPVAQGATGRSRSVYAVSARNQDIEACMKLFAQAKVPLRVIEIAELAQRNLAALYEVDHRALAMLSFSKDGGLLTFTSGGDLYLSRRIEIGFDQLVNVQGQMRDQLFERIALELQRSLDHFDRQFSSIPVARLLLAPLPEELGLSTYLAGNLSAPVETLNLGDVLDFHQVPELREPAEQFLRWQTLGTALRVEST